MLKRSCEHAIVKSPSSGIVQKTRANDIAPLESERCFIRPADAGARIRMCFEKFDGSCEISWTVRNVDRLPVFAPCARVKYEGFAACGETVSPEPIRPHCGRFETDQVFHGQSAPKSGMRHNASWNWQPRHRDQVAAIEIISQQFVEAGLVLVDDDQPSAVELHIIQEPGSQRRQVGKCLDVIVASARKHASPPTAALFAE